MHSELPSDGARDPRELPQQAPFSLHEDLTEVLDDTVGNALWHLPGATPSDELEACNRKGDRRPLHHEKKRRIREEDLEGQRARIIRGRPPRNKNYPFGPDPHKYPHYRDHSSPSVTVDDEN